MIKTSICCSSRLTGWYSDTEICPECKNHCGVELLPDIEAGHARVWYKDGTYVDILESDARTYANDPGWDFTETI